MELSLHKNHFFLLDDWLKSFQEFTAFALGGEDKGCNGTYVKAYDGDKETDNLILNKAGFQIDLLFGHFLLVGPIFCANFKNYLSAEMLFLKVFIHHQTISWFYFQLKVRDSLDRIPWPVLICRSSDPCSR